DLVMIVLNSSQIDRQLSLALQLRTLDIPFMLLLNMHDEARRAGITIDTEAMSSQLGMPVVQISAKYGDGCPEALQLAAQQLDQPLTHASPDKIAAALEADTAVEQEMESIVKGTVRMPARLTDELTSKVDKVLLHPWFGIPIFLLAMLLLFQFIFTLGAPFQDA